MDKSKINKWHWFVGSVIENVYHTEVSLRTMKDANFVKI
jgi:hypothetical protein